MNDNVTTYATELAIPGQRVCSRRAPPFTKKGGDAVSAYVGDR
jgi:hypothetical protein